ncbi:MAG: SdrD B-like domain-containing protein, partial [Pseudomonadota bacterium]
DGGNLIIEDAPGGPANAIMLISDYVLVINGGLFQAGTETDPLDRDFTLELTGDDPDFDLEVARIVNGEVANTIFAANGTAPVARDDVFDHTSGTTAVIDVLANDSDAETPRADLKIASVSNPDAGSVSIVDDTIHFTPDYSAYVTSNGLLDPNAEEVFTYRVSDADGNTSQARVTVDLSFEPGVVNGWVFVDDNQNGAFDQNSDTPVGGIVAHLMRGGETIATTSTLAGGFYQFENVPAGSGYTVRFFQQDGTAFVPSQGQYVGTANNLNSAVFDVDPGATVRQVNGIVQGNIVEVNGQPARIELGALEITQEDRGQWTRVDFEIAIPDAVVVAGPLSFNGIDSATVRVRNVDETGFEIQINEWAYLDGWHVTESVSWMAATRGTHQLSDGTVIQAGSTQAQDETKSEVTFDAAFDDAPIVFTQVASDNGSDAVATRNTAVTENGFSVQMQEEEYRDKLHVPEQVDWIAVEKGSTLLTTAVEMIDHAYKPIDLTDQGVLLADMQTMHGEDTANIRYDDSQGGIRLILDEENSLDEEELHLYEEIGILVAKEGGHYLSEFDAV